MWGFIYVMERQGRILCRISVLVYRTGEGMDLMQDA